MSGLQPVCLGKQNMTLCSDEDRVMSQYHIRQMVLASFSSPLTMINRKAIGALELVVLIPSTKALKS